MSGMEGLLQEMRRRPLVECVAKENQYKKREIIARRARIRLAARRKKKEKGKRLPRGAPGEARSRRRSTPNHNCTATARLLPIRQSQAGHQYHSTLVPFYCPIYSTVLDPSSNLVLRHKHPHPLRNCLCDPPLESN